MVPNRLFAVVVGSVFVLSAGAVSLTTAQVRQDGYEYAQGPIAVLEMEEYSNGEGVRVTVQLQGLDNHFFRLESRQGAALQPLSVALDRGLFVRFKVQARKDARPAGSRLDSVHWRAVSYAVLR